MTFSATGVIAAIVLSSASQGDSFLQYALEGVKAVYVNVEVNDEAKEIGVDASQIRTQVEKQLRSAGLGVADWACWDGQCAGECFSNRDTSTDLSPNCRAVFDASLTHNMLVTLHIDSWCFDVQDQRLCYIRVTFNVSAEVYLASKWEAIKAEVKYTELMSDFSRNNSDPSNEDLEKWNDYSKQRRSDDYAGISIRFRQLVMSQKAGAARIQRGCREIISPLTEYFVNVWLAANPKSRDDD